VAEHAARARDRQARVAARVRERTDSPLMSRSERSVSRGSDYICHEKEDLRDSDEDDLADLIEMSGMQCPPPLESVTRSTADHKRRRHPSVSPPRKGRKASHDQKTARAVNEGAKCSWMPDEQDESPTYTDNQQSVVNSLDKISRLMEDLVKNQREMFTKFDAVLRATGVQQVRVESMQATLSSKVTQSVPLHHNLETTRPLGHSPFSTAAHRKPHQG